MKQAIGAGVTLVLICIFCCVVVHAIGQQAQQAIQLTELAQQAETAQEAVALVKQAETFWESREWFFGTVMRHDDLEDIMQLYAILKAYALREDWDDYYGNCAAVLSRLRHISITERFRLQNIM